MVQKYDFIKVSKFIGLLIFLWSQTGIQTEEVEEPGITAGIHIKAIEVKFITKEVKLYMGDRKKN